MLRMLFRTRGPTTATMMSGTHQNALCPLVSPTRPALALLQNIQILGCYDVVFEPANVR